MARHAVVQFDVEGVASGAVRHMARRALSRRVEVRVGADRVAFIHAAKAAQHVVLVRVVHVRPGSAPLQRRVGWIGAAPIVALGADLVEPRVLSRRRPGIDL